MYHQLVVDGEKLPSLMHLLIKVSLASMLAPAGPTALISSSFNFLPLDLLGLRPWSSSPTFAIATALMLGCLYGRHIRGSSAAPPSRL